LGLQAAILSAYQFFCDHRIYYEGNTNPLFFYGGVVLPTAAWTFPNLRAAAGLPTTIDPSGSLADNNWFRRKRPREITSIADTQDVQGNPATAGQFAYLTGLLGFGFNRLHRCIASGNWVPVSDGNPDVLDNTLAYPNGISTAAGTSAVPGHQIGDYIGSWLFEEIRQIVNLLRWRWDAPQPTFLPNPSTGFMTNAFEYVNDQTTAFSTVSYADFLANAAAYFAATPPSTAPGANVTGTLYPIAYINASYDINWGGLATRQDCTWAVNSLGTLTKDVNWLVFGDASSGTGAGPPAPVTFDAQGDPVLNGCYHIWHVDSGVSATSVTSPKFGDATVVPPNAPPDPSAPGGAGAAGESYGYAVTDVVAITKFDVPGGFANLF
jgi:hypothetical protein